VKGLTVPHRKINVPPPNNSGYDQQLRAGALRWAEGDKLAEVGVHLLMDHGFWLEKLDAAGYVDRDGALAMPIFRRALKDLAREGAADGDDQGPGPRLVASGSEAAILRIAASLCGTGAVHLGIDLPKLDTRNIGLVAKALTEAAVEW
jgi:hypothetical protein